MSSEFEIIRRYFTRPAPSAALGVGDDCALVQAPEGQTLAVTSDMLVEGTHFPPGEDAQRLGHKTLAVNLSDLAAMGAEPRWCTLALSLPKADEAWLAAFARGFFALADRYGIELIGGDTTRGPLNLCVTAIGALPLGQALRRDGAVVGDDLWLSGTVGDAALGLACLQSRVTLDHEAREHCLNRLQTPEPRVALGCRLRAIASAAIDVSDGVAADVGHICERSAVGAEIDFDRLPRSAAFERSTEPTLALEYLLAGGDDYELAFTAPSVQRSAVAAAAAAAQVPVTLIGRIVSGSGVTALDRAGAPIPLRRIGFDHFR